MRKYPVSIAAGLALALCLCRPALAAPFPEGVKISAWARAEAESAYAAGLIPEGIDLGGDYTAPIRRGQFARLAVELTAAGTGTDTQTLLETYGLVPPASDPDGEEPPAEDAEGPSEETEEEAPAETGQESPAETGEEPPAETEEEPPADAGEETPEEPPTDAGGEAGEAPPAEQTPKIEPFADTDDPYILLAKQLGIAKGYAGGEFRPGSTLSRAEAAVMLQRCMAALGRTEANRAPQRFSDAYQIPRWAREAVKFASGRTTAAGKALMSGSGGQFRPLETYSVEQAILTMLRCYESRMVEGVSKNWRAAPGYDTVEITLSFGGDCTLGRGRAGNYAGSFDEMYDRMGPAYFFSNLKAFQTDDLSMVNFEGALTTWDTPRVQKEFIFKGRPEYAGILTAGSIDVVTVANNHSADYGDRGLRDTVNALSPYVAVSGYNWVPIVTVKGVKVGFASNVGWNFDAGQKKFITDAIRNLRARGAEIIVFNYHWGVEGAYRSNATQRAIAHYCIDSGADLVIGHHPHVVQETETYKGKQIVYSLGNLCFGGNRNPRDKNCLIFQETFSVDLDSRKAAEVSHQALKYKISSVSSRNDYRPTPA